MENQYKYIQGTGCLKRDITVPKKESGHNPKSGQKGIMIRAASNFVEDYLKLFTSFFSVRSTAGHANNMNHFGLRVGAVDGETLLPSLKRLRIPSGMHVGSGLPGWMSNQQQRFLCCREQTRTIHGA